MNNTASINTGNMGKVDETNEAALGIAAAAFIVGYVIGSGHWDSLAPIARRLFSHLGQVAIEHVVKT